MGEPDVARVDVAGVLAAARQFDTAAAIIDNAVRNHLARLAFDGASGGRMHTAGGDAVRNAVDVVVGRLSQWSRAATEIAAELRAGADRFSDADARAAHRIG
jgi:hypothetical protein